MRSCSLEIAMRAPVLPLDTAARASPSRTACTQFQRLEPLPRRKACAAFSSEAITLSVWRTSQTAAAVGSRANSALILGFVAMQQKSRRARSQPFDGQGHPGRRDSRPMIAAHGVDGNYDRFGHAALRPPNARRTLQGHSHDARAAIPCFGRLELSRPV
jgi:hypothetical protein